MKPRGVDAMDESAGDAPTTAPTPLLPMSPDLIHDELDSVICVLLKHKERLNRGLPGIDPEADERFTLDGVMTELIGEVMYCAGKLENLARTLSNSGA